MEDALRRPLETWTDSDVDGLVGRRESSMLEAKNPPDLTSDSSRKVLARAVAGLISSAGGFVVVGAEEIDHEISLLPGVRADHGTILDLQRALRDRVEPFPILNIRDFESADLDKRVVVIQVAADPAGRPASTGGRFYVRMSDETVAMSYQEVERRLSGLNQARLVAERTALDLRERVRGRASARSPSPVGVTLVPLFGHSDLGLSGEQLSAAWVESDLALRSAVSVVNANWDRLLSAFRAARATGHGLLVDTQQVRAEIDHSGSAAVFIAADSLHGHIQDDHPDPYVIATISAVWLGAILGFQRRIGLAGPLLVTFCSGDISGLSTTTQDGRTSQTASYEVDAQNRVDEVTAEIVAPLFGDTALAIAAGISLFVGRLMDAAGYPHSPSPTLEMQEHLLARVLPQAGF